MKASCERMDYIIDYLSSYENKIKAANKLGLFDAAKMFELFAQNVCALWFGQPFTNLNADISNYPYVDLIGEDKTIFVQVSTTRDIGQKVKNTLEKIRDAKNDRYAHIERIVFFVLSSESVPKLKDYSGDNKIGNIEFSKKNDLITTKDVYERAQADLDFQIQLFDLLKKDEHRASGNAEAFRKALSFSSIGLENIDSFINGEYRIDRSDLISKIHEENNQFVSIQGPAGCGKSALCKMLLENENMVLYARAERFKEENNLTNIWAVDIEDMLDYINEKSIVFFIDALEFISDCRETKHELLQQLYTVSLRHKNVFIVTSCRSSEKSAFIKLEINFDIRTYEVKSLSENELIPIVQKYPAIAEMYQLKAYHELLRNPFYINLILEKHISISSINDEISFREYVWSTIICLKEKATRYGLKYNEIINVVESIVFERAKNNLLGVRADKFDGNVLAALLSEGVLAEQGGYVRLKFDVFEDVCFEHYFDAEFDDCKGNYSLFYNQISSFGRCSYRRYQIWISNKLFGAKDRDKFLYKLIFADTLPAEWKKQTEIGIVKSRHCRLFFEEQEANLIESTLLSDFIKITNLFAFEAKILTTHSGDPRLALYPIGDGRAALIYIICKHELFKNDDLKQGSMVKLCQDYAKQNAAIAEANNACSILSYYVDAALADIQIVQYYRAINVISPCLEALYQMPIAAKEWIKTFWSKLAAFYKSGDRRFERTADDIIKWTIQNAYPELVASLSTELCLLAETHWTYTPVETSRMHRSMYDIKSEQYYGLNENAINYTSHNRNIESNLLMRNLFYGSSFHTGFQWAISFVNKAISAYADSQPDDVIKVSLYFAENEQMREYWGNPNMWLTATEEHVVPILIGDIIYLLKEALIKVIAAYMGDANLGILFANKIKEEIYTKSNNIALLSIIENVGMHFQREMPGYALDLASSLDLICWDYQRCSQFTKDPTRQLLEKQILLAVGIPEFKSRYQLDEKCGLTLQNYVFNAQVYFGHELKPKCHQILDYLYSTIKNDEEQAGSYLQIQKMDARNVKIQKIDENTVAISPQISGAAAKMVQKHEDEIAKTKGPIAEMIKGYTDSISSNDHPTEKALKLIDTLMETIRRSETGFQYENVLITLIASVFKDESLSIAKRSQICSIWISGIRRVFSNGSFAVDTKLCPILFNQINSNISVEQKNEIKLLMLECLLNRSHHGIISEYAKYVKSVLSSNLNLSLAMLNTIVKLAEDEMNHQKFNADYLQKRGDCNTIDFVPNMTPRLSAVDFEIESNGVQKFASQRAEIINKFLFNDSELDYKNFNIEDYDIPTLCYISNCGFRVDNPEFAQLLKKILVCLVDIWYFNKHDRYDNEALDGDCIAEVVELFRKEIVWTDNSAQPAIDMLFDCVEFSKFTDKTIEFYHDIFDNFLPQFFDAYNEPAKRSSCKGKIKYIEQKINNIENDYVRTQLYKSLFLSVPKYCGDWSICVTKYSYEDIQFLNQQFSKYGKYHLREALRTIYQLRIDELLPNILPSIKTCFDFARGDIKSFADAIISELTIVRLIVYKAFVKHSDSIKADEELTVAFEGIFEALVDLNYEDAAVLLDEFRIH